MLRPEGAAQSRASQPTSLRVNIRNAMSSRWRAFECANGFLRCRFYSVGASAAHHIGDVAQLAVALGDQLAVDLAEQ